MLEKITGSEYKSMIRYGINHLDKYCAVVNDLNVFPVPDGDTGTNMVMTMKNGYQAIDGSAAELSAVARSFANATVFGARGNSGVIVSQFFKGVSKGLSDVDEADCSALSRALDMGCEYAYAAVAEPVEGTILTVIKDAADAVRARLSDIDAVDELIALFLAAARGSLENTPNLLPILAKAGVVDSGGSGLVYFFEGVQRYLNGEELETVDNVKTTASVDYAAFNRYTRFDYGFCTELLLQVMIDPADFRYDELVAALGGLGDSLVTTQEDDKVKVHIHTPTPERVLALCHEFRCEFLTVKIENMTVQHTQTTQKILCSKTASPGHFAVVAVAPNAMLQAMLVDMGADAVILSEEVPSSQDFIEAFERLSVKEILVFPNSSNSILSAMQAGSLYKNAKITVLNCRSIAECYPALAIIDYENEDIGEVVDAVNDTIRNIREVAVVHAVKNIEYGSHSIVKNDYFALSGKDVLYTADKFETVVYLTVAKIMSERDSSVITLFYGQNPSRKTVDALAAEIGETYPDVEVCIIPTQDAVYDLIISFE